MLANRADIYNLGDTLAGRDKEFSLSFIENSLTSNKLLAPLATRDIDDVYKFVDIADGNQIALTEFNHSYSQAEANEIISVLKHIRSIQKTILLANKQYIASAAQDDKYRIEPPFKLQGSYRNMNKMAEKVVPAMTEQELLQLIDDHYRGEAQTLTKGAEENLLKLAELRQCLTDEQAKRWQQIKTDYVRHQNLGNDDNPLANIANQVSLLQSSLLKISEHIAIQQHVDLTPLTEAVSALKLSVTLDNNSSDVIADAVNAFAITVQESLIPLLNKVDNIKPLDDTLLTTLTNLLDKKSSSPSASFIQHVGREVALNTEPKNKKSKEKE
jgi:hypothetical protein